MTSRDEPTRILFVDDDAAMHRLFVRTMRPWGFEIDTAFNVAEALDLEQRGRYPVVVTDYCLDEGDGVSLIDALAMTNPDAVFIVLTGLTDLEVPMSRAAERAVFSVVSKPWDAEELATSIRRALSLRASSMPAAGQTPSLLLIEDNECDAELVSDYLACAGPPYRIAQVGTLTEAVSLLREQHFDVVLSDLSLPDARGLDAVMRLQPVAPRAALVLLSGVDNEDLAVQAVQLGAQDYLVKADVNAALLHRAIRYATERKRAELRLSELAHSDSLTGLANRTSFRDRLGHALARSKRQGLRLAVLYLDLDRFKPVNDLLGHDAGDVLLQEVGRRLEHCVREYDTVARLGGDEFAVLVEDIQDSSEAIEIAERISDAIAHPVTLGGSEVRVGASIGLSLYPVSASNVDGLLKCADAAMYRAKGAGRSVQVYSAHPSSHPAYGYLSQAPKSVIAEAAPPSSGKNSSRTVPRAEPSSPASSLKRDLAIGGLASLARLR